MKLSILLLIFFLFPMISNAQCARSSDDKSGSYQIDLYGNSRSNWWKHDLKNSESELSFLNDPMENSDSTDLFFLTKQEDGLYTIHNLKTMHYLHYCSEGEFEPISNEEAELVKNSPEFLMIPIDRIKDGKPSHFDLSQVDWDNKYFKFNGKFLQVGIDVDRPGKHIFVLADTYDYNKAYLSLSQHWAPKPTYRITTGKDFILLNKKVHAPRETRIVLKPAELCKDEPFRDYSSSLGGFTLNNPIDRLDEYELSNAGWRFHPINENRFLIQNIKYASLGVGGMLLVENGEVKCENVTNYDNAIWKVIKVTPEAKDEHPYNLLYNEVSGLYLGAPSEVVNVPNLFPVLGDGKSDTYKWELIDAHPKETYGKDAYLGYDSQIWYESWISKQNLASFDESKYYTITKLGENGVISDNSINSAVTTETTSSTDQLQHNILWKITANQYGIVQLKSHPQSKTIDGCPECYLANKNGAYSLSRDWFLDETNWSLKLVEGNTYQDLDGQKWIIKEVEAITPYNDNTAFRDATALGTVSAIEDYKALAKENGLRSFFYADWEIAKIKNTPLAYKEYAHNHPPSSEIGEHHFIEALWREAYLTSTKSSYEKYINIFPYKWRGTSVYGSSNSLTGEELSHVIKGVHLEEASYRKAQLCVNNWKETVIDKEAFEEYLTNFPEGNYRIDMVLTWLNQTWNRAYVYNDPEYWQAFIDLHEYIHHNYYQEYYDIYSFHGNLPKRLEGSNIPSHYEAKKILKDYEYYVVGKLKRIKVLDGDEIDVAGINVQFSTDRMIEWDAWHNDASFIYRPPGEFERSAGEEIVPDFNNWGIVSAKNSNVIYFTLKACESDDPAVGGYLDFATNIGALMKEQERSHDWMCGSSDVLALPVGAIPLNSANGYVTTERVLFTDRSLIQDDVEIRVDFEIEWFKMTSPGYEKYLEANNLTCGSIMPKLQEPTQAQLNAAPGYIVRNETDYPLQISLSQPILGNMYYGVIQPGQIFFREIGALPLTFNLNAEILLNGEETITDKGVISGAIFDGVMFATAIASGGVTAGFQGGLIQAMKVAAKSGGKLGAKATLRYIAENSVQNVLKSAALDFTTTKVMSFANTVEADYTEDVLETTNYFTNSYNGSVNSPLQVFSVTGGPKMPCIDPTDFSVSLFKPEELRISRDKTWQKLLNNMQEITDPVGSFIGVDTGPYNNVIYQEVE